MPGTLESEKANSAGAHLPAAPDVPEQAASEPQKMAQPKIECRSPVGLDCCNCCLDLANRCDLQKGRSGENNPGSPTVSNFRQLQEKLVFENLNTDKLNNIMRQDSLEPVLRDPCYLINEGICNRNIDQTMLSILLFFHRWVSGQNGCESGPDGYSPVTGAGRRWGALQQVCKGVGGSRAPRLRQKGPLGYLEPRRAHSVLAALSVF